MMIKSIFGLMAVIAILLSQLVLANLDPIIIDDPIDDPIPIDDPPPIVIESRSFSGHKGNFDYDISVHKLSQNGNNAVFFYSVGICDIRSTDNICLAFVSLNSEGRVLKNNDAWVINDDFVKAKLYSNTGNLKVEGYPSVLVETKVK